MQKMKAAIRRHYGPPRNISVEKIDRPSVKDSEVLIKVHATTVNRTDCANLTAKPFIMRFILGLFKPKKIIIGTDFAGEVVSVGENVSPYSVGDSVFGFTDSGSESQAEYVVATVENLFPMPKNVDYKQAAASLEGAHYAYSFIQKSKIHAGQSILINGASGGIGSALIQLVKPFNVKITATCNTKNINLIKSLGADKVFDYTKEDFTTDSDTYDFIFDAVGNSTFRKCNPLLKENGTYLSSELGPYSQNVFFALFAFLSKKKVVFPVPYNKKLTIPYISNQLEDGTYKPIIDREYSLKEISKAYEYVASGQKTGNVIINI